MNTQDCSPLGWTGWTYWLDQSISKEKSDKTEQQRRSEGKALREKKKKIFHVIASVDHKIEASSEWDVLEAIRFCVIDIMH